MLVLPDGDIDAVADAAVSAGHGADGQRCMAIAVVVAVVAAGDRLVAEIRKRIAAIRVGPGLELGPKWTHSSRGSIETGLRLISTLHHNKARRSKWRDVRTVH